LPRALMDKDTLDFSFSGLKSAVLRCAEQMFGSRRADGIPGSFQAIIDPHESPEIHRGVQRIAAAFQDAVTDVLVAKAFRAAKRCGVKHLVVCGGVAANGSLRQKAWAEGAATGIEAVFPSLSLCTDNAAMIAFRAMTLLEAGYADDLTFGALSRWENPVPTRPPCLS
jgi:N6-L-threonylcarbamoyladenine synthase